jgi:hypothetical protein
VASHLHSPEEWDGTLTHLSSALAAFSAARGR